MNDDLKISQIVAGVMNWGSWGANLSSKEVALLINQCLELGITTFDHADIYGHYTTEELFGNAFASSSVRRSDIQLVTKCGILLPCNARPQIRLKSYNTSKSHIIQSLEQSLTNLKTDYVDLLLIHRPSPLMHPEEIAEAFTSLKKDGKVLHFGVSNFTPSQFDLINQYIPLTTNQIEASVLHLTPFSDGSLEHAISNKYNPMIWSPLNGGNLFALSKDHELVSTRSRLKNVADKYGWTLDQLAYKFLLHHPSKMIPVTGSSKIERIRSAVESKASPITDEQWFEVWTAATGKRVP